MSKSLGTGVDPGKIIAEKGADALRFTLLGQAGHNQEIRYSERKTDDARNFCNKIWNATRFILMNMDGVVDTEPAELAPIDQWLLSRLARAERISKAAYDDYDLQEASQTLYKFFWSELCDWYIEISKPRLANEATRATCQWVLLRALEGFATMMHPIMPHITEEVYAHLPIANKSPFVMSAPWPDVARFENADVETRVERWIEITRSVRALRAEIGLIDLKKTAEGYFEGDLEGGDEVIRTQSALTSLVAGVPAQKHVSITVEGVDIHIPIEGLIDSEKEGQRLQKELEKTQTEHDKLAERLSNPQFVERAKPEIVDRERENLSELASKLAKIQERIRLFSN